VGSRGCSAHMAPAACLHVEPIEVREGLSCVLVHPVTDISCLTCHDLLPALLLLVPAHQ
jgi:hypothetical protein